MTVVATVAGWAGALVGAPISQQQPSDRQQLPVTVGRQSVCSEAQTSDGDGWPPMSNPATTTVHMANKTRIAAKA